MLILDDSGNYWKLDSFSVFWVYQNGATYQVKAGASTSSGWPLFSGLTQAQADTVLTQIANLVGVAPIAP